MSDIYRIAGIGMQEGRQRLEAISLNAASASLPGYRRHVAVGRAFDASLAAAAPTPNHVDLRRGATIATGRALDLAIEADDMYFALTDGSNTWLTRAGAFRVDADGLLVGERGLRVVGTQGDVRLPGSEVEVDATGQILYQGARVAAVQLFVADSPTSLRAAQGALLSAAGGQRPAEAGAGRVRSGALEAANTDSGREMLGLLTLSRQYESLSRVVQGYDELLGRTIQKLGEF
jgi:flagellar basal-body rod protein FlgF